MEKRTKRNGFRLGILMLCTVMLLFAVMPTGVLADEDGTETYPITFSVTPENATIKLYKNSSSGAYGDPIQPGENGVYNIPFGQYRYIISADGYVTANKTFNATDTALENNNYVITVNLKELNEEPDASELTKKILSDANDLFRSDKYENVLLNEFSGYLGDDDDGYIAWSINSDYEDRNVLDWVRKVLNDPKNNGKFKDVTVSVDDSDYYDIIDKDGLIHYDAVSEDDYDSDYYDGICCTVWFALSLNGVTQDGNDAAYVTFVVPAHTFTRQERLEQTADDVMKGILGTNPSKDAVTDDLVLPRLLEGYDYGQYFIDSSWKSSYTSVIANDGTVTRPDYDKNVTLNLRVFYAESFIDNDDSFLFDPGPIGEGETFRTVTVTVKGTLGEKEPEPEPEPKPEPDPLPIIMFNSLTFDTNGGTAVSTVRSMQWSTIDLSSYTTEKEGYVFTGWYLDAECTKPCDKVTMDRNITVYAGWEKIAEFPYTDVTSDEWFFDDVRYVWDNGLIDGVTEDTFEPEANVTRAVLIEALWRAEGRPEAESAGLFTDVAEDNAFAGAIAWAKETGIANGYDDGRFGIDDVVTREQTAAFLYRYAQYKKMDVSVGEDTNILSFDDIDTASEYAIPALCWACGADILRGDGNGCLRPADTVTRAELSAQLNRFIEAAR